MYFVRRQTENGQSAEDAEQSALSDSVRNSVLMLSERSLKWPHLPLRIKSMQIWSLILDRAQNDEMMELIGFDAERSEFSQSEQFENVVVGVLQSVLRHFTVRFHKLEHFETEQEWQSMRSELQSLIKKLLIRCFVVIPLRGMQCLGQFTVSVLGADGDPNHCTFSLFILIFLFQSESRCHRVIPWKIMSF